MTRRFQAQPERVWRAFTQPELMKRWLYGPEKWRLEVCTVDLRPGGALRYEWHGPGGEVMGMSGEFGEVDPPHRMVHTEIFDEDSTGRETVVTSTFAPDAPGAPDDSDGDATVVPMNVRYASKEARAGALKTAMAEGMDMDYARLDGPLAEGRVAG